MLIRVFEIPKMSGKFLFAGAEVRPFLEVDWFRDEENMMEEATGQHRMEDFIKRKTYFDENKSYLILNGVNTFTINYSAP